MKIYKVVENFQWEDYECYEMRKESEILGYFSTLKKAMDFVNTLLKNRVNSIDIEEGFGRDTKTTEYEIYEIKEVIVQ